MPDKESQIENPRGIILTKEDVGAIAHGCALAMEKLGLSCWTSISMRSFVENEFRDVILGIIRNCNSPYGLILRGAGRMVPDLTNIKHACEYQDRINLQLHDENAIRNRTRPTTCIYTEAEPGTTGENAQPCGQIAENGSQFCAGHAENDEEE